MDGEPAREPAGSARRSGEPACEPAGSPSGSSEPAREPAGSAGSRKPARHPSLVESDACKICEIRNSNRKDDVYKSGSRHETSALATADVCNDHEVILGESDSRSNSACFNLFVDEICVILNRCRECVTSRLHIFLDSLPISVLLADEMPSEQAEVHSAESQDPRTCQSDVAEKHLRPAVVRYPDGSIETFKIHKNAEAQVLFDLTMDMRLPDPDDKPYFTLSFTSKKGKKEKFVNNDKALAKQVEAADWNFNIRFKFYPQDPEYLVNDIARQFLVNQCMSDIYTGRIPRETLGQAEGRLSALVAQAEIGNYAPSEGYGDYVRGRNFSTSVDYDFINLMETRHESYRGLSSEEAYKLYLDICKDLAFYGVHRFETKDNTDRQPIDVGVCAKGVVVYTEGEGMTHMFEWKHVEKITFRRRYFCMRFIRELPEELHDLQGATVVFKLRSIPATERFYKLVVEHHEFFRLMKRVPKVKSRASFFQWIFRRFWGRPRVEDEVVAPSEYTNDESVRTYPLEESIEPSEEDSLNLSTIDRFEDAEGGCVYSLPSAEPFLEEEDGSKGDAPEGSQGVVAEGGSNKLADSANHEGNLLCAILEATSLPSEVVVERVEVKTTTA
ncbi:hypothetical protein L596_018837 [Steinernema carpocapsae]|uniref:FERM domain-containing protein n=1 Tax=Steinernema carpocapsae TaxID=34508 RepID=A0A4U5N6D5_STECR|nr:hypothetical protein L596_018837 [Steinernema carpocapsae]